MKAHPVPQFVDDEFVSHTVGECVRFVKGEAPWWYAHSCLNCRESRLLVQVFLLAYSTWCKRQTQQPKLKRISHANNRFDLRPLLYDLSYTIATLSHADLSAMDKDSQALVQQCASDSLAFLKQYHNVSSSELSSLPLAQVS